MDENLPHKLLPEIYTDVASKPLGVVGGWLGAAIYLKAHGKIERAKDLQALHEINRQTLTARVEQLVRNIPSKNLLEPTTQNLILAMQTAEFCIDEDVLREMFAHLLAASFDSTKKAHPSFYSIVTQMSARDALLLRELVNAQPIVKFTVIYADGKKEEFLADSIISPDNPHDVTSYSASLNALEYLGVVKTDYDSTLEKALYMPFIQSSFYFDLCEEVKNNPDAGKVGYLRGRAILTKFGMDFLTCCNIE